MAKINSGISHIIQVHNSLCDNLSNSVIARPISRFAGNGIGFLTNHPSDPDIQQPA